jgi:hypothetical protein
MPIPLETLQEAARRRPSIPKLAGASFPSLKVKPQFTNELLQSGATWPQDVNYLRDTYNNVSGLWNSLPFSTSEQQKILYERTEPKLEELLMGLRDIFAQRSGRIDLYKTTERAGHDAQVAELYAKAGDFTTASFYQSYALSKLHSMLEALTMEGKRKRAVFLVKTGYGYDQSGEIQEGVGTNADQKAQWDTGGPGMDGNKTPKPQGNISVDTDADKDFPELLEKKHHRVQWPARTD